MWLSAFQARLARGERDAVRLYPELLRMVNGDRTVLVLAVWRDLGVSNEQEARALIGLAKSVDGLERPAVLEMARELLSAEGWRCLPPDTAVNGQEAQESTQGNGGRVGGGGK